MCGRFFMTLEAEDLEAAFPDFKPPAEWRPRYNIAPTQPVPVVINDGQQRITFLQWGLVPAWAKDPAMGNRLINARAETLAEKPSFRAAYRQRRCLILADGFYEWRVEPGQRGKTPLAIRLRSGAPFAFAGLWEVWHPDDTPLLTCTLITTEPNALLAPIHNRMPVILPRSAYAGWLDPAERAPHDLQSLLTPYPAEEMIAYPVSTRVNDPANEDPACIAPA